MSRRPEEGCYHGDCPSSTFHNEALTLEAGAPRLLREVDNLSKRTPPLMEGDTEMPRVEAGNDLAESEHRFPHALTLRYLAALPPLLVATATLLAVFLRP